MKLQSQNSRHVILFNIYISVKEVMIVYVGITDKYPHYDTLNKFR